MPEADAASDQNQNAIQANQSAKPPADPPAQPTADLETMKAALRAQQMTQAFDQQIAGKLGADTPLFVPPTATDVAAGSQFSDEPPRLTAASRMKQKVRDVLDAQPFHAEHIHKADLIAVIDALIDGPDDEGPGY